MLILRIWCAQNILEKCFWSDFVQINAACGQKPPQYKLWKVLGSFALNHVKRFKRIGEKHGFAVYVRVGKARHAVIETSHLNSKSYQE